MTVGELKERMTTAERADWVRYVEEFGPLNLAWRIDYAVARAAAPFIGAGSLQKLMVWPQQEDREASIEDVMGMLRAAKKTDKAANG